MTLILDVACGADVVACSEYKPIKRAREVEDVMKIEIIRRDGTTEQIRMTELTFARSDGGELLIIHGPHLKCQSIPWSQILQFKVVEA